MAASRQSRDIFYYVISDTSKVAFFQHLEFTFASQVLKFEISPTISEAAI